MRHEEQKRVVKVDNMIVLTSKGDYKKTESWLKNMNNYRATRILHKCGEAGVNALIGATPVDTGLTASSWYYEIEEQRDGSSQIVWKNSNVNKGVNIAVILQYGHGTGTGGYVIGTDYINPALTPVFEKLLYDLKEELERNG